MQKPSVFEETYTNYLARIAELDFVRIAERLGAEWSSGELIIPFFGNSYRVSWQGLSDTSGKRPNFSVCVVLKNTWTWNAWRWWDLCCLNG